MRKTEAKSVLVVVLATDRVLCGGLNTNLFRGVRQWIDAQKKQSPQTSITILPWGRKACRGAVNKARPVLLVEKSPR